MKTLVTTLLLVWTAGFALGTDDFSTGRKLHTAKCARCHKLYDPTGYDQKTWDKWMGRMRRKARLNDEQYQQLMAYLDSVRESKGANSP